jgi:tetratricopeptide (TPR) repeat protein
MRERELPNDIYQQITSLCKRGDDLLKDSDERGSYECYAQAWALIPEPKIDWEASTWVLTALGEVKFRRGQYDDAKNLFLRAVQCPKGLGNPYLHLRIGQAQFETGNLAGAKDNLARAFMGGGLDIFKQEEEKYVAFLRQFLEGV